MKRALVALLFALACKDDGSVDNTDSMTDDSEAPAPVDGDGDGHSEDVDCDDADPSAYPDAEEGCDEVDNDCDGAIDEGVATTVYVDGDGDGFGDEASAAQTCEPSEGQVLEAGDCDDENDSAYPGADELCDGADNDCDGEADEDDAVDTMTFFYDLDLDGYGDPENPVDACTAPSGAVSDSSDCDDGDDAVYPGADELCDAKDSDCDGVIAETLVPTDHATLNEALYNSGSSWICLEAGVHVDSASYTLVEDLVVEGVGSDRVTVDADGAEAAFVFNLDGHGLTLRGMSITGGDSGGADPGGVSLRGGAGTSATLEDLILTGNRCENSNCLGAALGANQVDSITLSGVESYDNELIGYARGSLSFVECRDVVLEDVYIHDERVTEDAASGAQAGGLFIWSDVQDGSGSLVGSASLNEVVVEGVEMSSSTTTYGGGAMLAYLGTLDITNSSFIDNHVTTSGTCVTGGLTHFFVVDTALRNVEIAGNSCESTGAGGIVAGLWLLGTPAEASVATAENLIVAGNSLTAVGSVSGGVMLSYYIDASFTNASVVGNTVSGSRYEGGWVNYDAGSSTTLLNVSYSGNSLSGGATTTTGVGSRYAASPFTWTYTNLTDLGSSPYGQYQGDATGINGNLSEDPGYVDTSSANPWEWDLTLGSGSALIDAGAPSILDPDGSASDIGAYGGPGAADW